MSIWKLTDKDPIKINGKNVPGEAALPISDNMPDIAERADSLIADGDYIHALDLYCSLSAKDSSNMYLRQRVEELRSLVLLSGLRNDLIIFRLEKFRNLIGKRSREIREHYR